MSILIKGMEMPTNCWECPMVSGYEIADEVRTRCSTVRCRLTNTKRPAGEAIAPDCPLVPVPEHGRLIDADALMEIISKVIGINASIDQRNEATDQERRCLWWFEEQVNIAPTIIPAEGGDAE